MTPTKGILMTDEGNSSMDSSNVEMNPTDDRLQRKVKKSKNSQMSKDSDEYRRRRERNNLAVKKSRNKSKLQTQQTLERVQKLKAENEMLEVKIKILSKELSFLKDLFLAHAGNAHGGDLTAADLNVLNDEAEVDKKPPAPEM
ncbi:CCAAT/enhancer-binding protein gamma-like [Tachypleus tridentatus]|uniref:CCAAT/enhancer-binding protein gamma-like n=1 Tax=Tachypleus tridentatus TaxID=6853 RepID=UPI003FD11842